MIQKRFTPMVGCLLAIVVSLVAPGGSLLGAAGAAGAFAADGVKAGQRIEVAYVVGAKTVFASAVLGADGTLSFAFPSEDGLRVGWAYYKLVRLDVGPEPKPDLKPDPPTPVKRTTDIYVVWETADAGPAEAAIRNAAAWKDESAKLKIRWGQFDHQTIAGIPKFKAVSEAAKGKIPCVVLVDEAGKATTEPLPKTPAAMLELVKKLKGT